LNKKKYLITGGSGFIGSALVHRMVEEGYGVRVLDNDLRGVSTRLSGLRGRLELVKADVRDRKAVRKACKGIDGVCHMAYLNGTEFFYSKPDIVLDIGVKGMVNVIDSCVLEGIKELILLSSSEVYQTPPAIPTDEKAPLSVPDPLNPRYSYGGGKIISELMSLNYGRKYFKRVMVIRPHNVYGPNMGWEHVVPQFIVRMKGLCANGKNSVVKFPVRGDGSQSRAFTFIDDFASGFMLVLKKGKHLEIYNIGTTEEVMIKKVARHAGAYFGRKVVLAPGKAPRGETVRRCPDISKIERLGYQQEVAFAEGFKITADWYANSTHMPPQIKNRKVNNESIYLH